MLSTASLVALNRAAARKAAGTRLVELWPDDIAQAKTCIASLRGKVPFIGTRCPRGWQRVDIAEIDSNPRGVRDAEYFVDSSGWGSPTEAALTIREFVDRLQVGYGYGLTSVGEFQVFVGVWKQRRQIRRAA